MQPVRIAVRMLVEHVLSSGDIDQRYADGSAMYEGARAHRRLQQAMGEGYQKEVSLRMEAVAGEIPVLLHGRADGIFHDADGGIVIDEIKTTTMPLARIKEQQALHTGQAKCYGHMLLAGMDAPPTGVTIQLTYYQLDTDELERIQLFFSAGELACFVEGLLGAYAPWLRFANEWAILRQQSIRGTSFPYPAYRKGQRKLAVAAYAAIQSGKRLYATAPTGTGKTMAALFPAVKAMGEGLAEKLFYLTAKTVTRAVAEDAARRMAQEGLQLKTLTLRAKEKICFCEEVRCNPEHCPYAKGHYDRVHDALYAMLTEETLFTPDIVCTYARAHTVCPFELSLDAAEWADLVICDYNHVFDPVVALRRFFADGGGAYVFLVDEAHNLSDRVRDMYTAALEKSAFQTLSREIKDTTAHARRLKKSANAINRHLRDIQKGMEGPVQVAHSMDEAFQELVAQFVLEAANWLYQERRGIHPLQEALLPLYFEARFYMQIAGMYGDNYTTITEAHASSLRRTLYCMDPSNIIAAKLRLAKASVLFSATMRPLPYYRELLGGDEGDGMLELISPFAQEHLRLFAHAGISTKYADRAGSIAPIVEAMHAAVAQRPGNYIAYFPSYEYLRAVHAQFVETYPAIRCMAQQTDMDEEARASFLEMFDADNAQTLLGFCVLGGLFSEGIDLAGERLVGAIIVGVGLPKLSLRQNLIRDYFSARGADGFAYAYVYPGMNKVLQAAGRVIRSETDEGIVLLIDSRFNTALYRALFPAHWSHICMTRSTEQLQGHIAAPRGIV